MNVKDFPKITFILRGYTYEQVRKVITVLLKSKFRSIEIPLNSPDVFTTIYKIREEFGETILVGAGTVLTHEDAVKSIESGAQFLLSPIMMSEETLNYCRQQNVISIPGAATPTEIYQSFQQGADLVKVFPAARLGSKFFSDIQSPLGKLPLMAVGGMNQANVQEYFEQGVSYIGIGSGVFNLEDLENENFDLIEGKIKALEQFI